MKLVKTVKTWVCKMGQKLGEIKHCALLIITYRQHFETIFVQLKVVG